MALPRTRTMLSLCTIYHNHGRCRVSGGGQTTRPCEWFSAARNELARLRQVVWELFYNPSAVERGCLFPVWGQNGNATRIPLCRLPPAADIGVEDFRWSSRAILLRNRRRSRPSSAPGCIRNGPEILDYLPRPRGRSGRLSLNPQRAQPISRAALTGRPM
jgi:hypothetical protein